ncbi:MAG: 8-oxo-dGTP pyrophosphatase MutT (NUDIX family) [Gammaproteobacteria bacterium]|jgi:8-oxo-dGTP pyrophosphatase MutT (NUDIX family)
MSETAPATASPAATVILLRDGTSGLETLLLRRNSKLAFHGGSWVFPGGRVDRADYPDAEGEDEDGAATYAAVREAKEESGLDVDRDSLIYFSHWTTPVGLPKRFSTWFYLAPAPNADVQIDGGEIHDHRWMGASQALAAQRAGEIELPAPTFVTLLTLEAFDTLQSVVSAFQGKSATIFLPRNQPVQGGRLSLYQRDAGYHSETVNAQGPRHRLWMVEGGWRYENTTS